MFGLFYINYTAPMVTVGAFICLIFYIHIFDNLAGVHYICYALKVSSLNLLHTQLLFYPTSYLVKKIPSFVYVQRIPL